MIGIGFPAAWYNHYLVELGRYKNDLGIYLWAVSYIVVGVPIVSYLMESKGCCEAQKS